jgi:hypothetical protein
MEWKPSGPLSLNGLGSSCFLLAGCGPLFHLPLRWQMGKNSTHVEVHGESKMSIFRQRYVKEESPSRCLTEGSECVCGGQMGLRGSLPGAGSALT